MGWVSIVLFWTMLASSSAAAGGVARDVHVPAADAVALAGGRVVFQQGNREVDSVLPGSVPRRLALGPGDGRCYPPDCGRSRSTFLAFAASSQALAVESDWWQNYHGVVTSEGGSFGFGALDGPYPQVPNAVACSPSSPVVPFTVSGSLLAYLSCAANPTLGSPGRLVLHATGPAAPPDRSIALPAGLSHVNALAMAGYVLAAYLSAPGSSSGAVVVWDAATGTERYRVPVAAVDHSLAVQADGTVAFTFVRSGGCTGVGLAWASPLEPSEHALPGCVVDNGVRLVDGRLAYLAGPPSASALVTTDLFGGARRTALSPGGIPVGFDFDGANLAIARPACDGGAVIRLEPATTDDSARVDPRCPGALPRQHPRVVNRRVRVRVRCPIGCHGRLTIRTLSGMLIGSAAVTVPQQQRSRRIVVKLRRAALRLAHGGKLSVRVTLKTRRLDRGATVASRAIVLAIS